MIIILIKSIDKSKKIFGTSVYFANNSSKFNF